MSKQTGFGSVQEHLLTIYRKAAREGVALSHIDGLVERYASRQAVTEKFDREEERQFRKQLLSESPAPARVLAFAIPTVFLAIGVFLISSAVVPIASYFVTNSLVFAKENFESPIPREAVLQNSLPVLSTTVVEDLTAEEVSAPAPVILDTELDYTNLSNWFDSSDKLSSKQSKDEYILEIPKLEIYNARVQIGGSDLEDGLIHYPGTADPGQLGAPVIFGHSVLRQFYRPEESNSRRYNSIFSYIMTLEPGDKIYLHHDELKYTYTVTDKTEVKPEDTYILAQQYDGRRLKLVTCTPEGTYLRRGVVTAVLTK